MKRMLSWILVLTLLLSGCAGATRPTPASTTESELQEYEEIVVPTQEPEKEYPTFGLSYLPAYGLNPYLCTATANRAIFSLMYEGLFTINEQFRAEPVLCESFRVSDDGRTYRFPLVDAKFSDGSPVTAADVEASIAAAKKKGNSDKEAVRQQFFHLLQQRIFPGSDSLFCHSFCTASRE